MTLSTQHQHEPMIVSRGISSPVRLNVESKRGFWGRLNWLIETFVFWRLQSFKNYPRANFIALQSILVVSSVGTICALFSATLLALILLLHPPFAFWNEWLLSEIADKRLIIAINVPFGFVGAVSIVYWNLRKSFHEKWEY